MTLDLKSLKPSRQMKPPRIILYGPPGIGKSTFASNVKGAIFLDVEGGTGNLNVVRIGREKLETYEDVTAALNALLTQDHQFSTVVIDTADFLEKVLQRQVAAEFGKKDFAMIGGYGREYVALANLWAGVTQTLDEIRDKRGMAIILLAHEKLMKIKEPDVETYEKYTLAMETKSIELLESWTDVILFAKEEVYTEKDKTQRVRARAGDRMMFTMDCPAHLAKNRYNLPREIPFAWAAFSEAFDAATAEPKPEKKGKEAA